MKKLFYCLLFLVLPIQAFAQAGGVPVDRSGGAPVWVFPGKIELTGDGKTTIELRPDLNAAVISGQSNVPTAVTIGIAPGYSLPIWNSDHEQLFFDIHVPTRWDCATNITVHIDCALASAQDANAHTFQLQVTWDKVTITANEAIPTSGEHDVGVNTNTAISAAQYTSYRVDFTIDYDADTPDNIACGDNLLLRVRRITETGDNTEITGELIINHVGLVFTRDKLGP